MKSKQISCSLPSLVTTTMGRQQLICFDLIWKQMAINSLSLYTLNFFINLSKVSELFVHKMKVKGKKDSTFDKDEEIWIIKQYHQGYSSTQVRRNFVKPLTLTDLWKICVYFGQNRNHSLSRLATELPNKKWKKCTGQKCLIERNSEKQNLRKLVHGAPSSTTFKMYTCYLNTLYKCHWSSCNTRGYLDLWILWCCHHVHIDKYHF